MPAATRIPGTTLTLACLLTLKPAVGAAPREEILSDKPPWRSIVVVDPSDAPALPGNGWAGIDCDDAGWTPERGPVLGGCGGSRNSGVFLVYVRGRFGPAALVFPFTPPLWKRGQTVALVGTP